MDQSVLCYRNNRVIPTYKVENRSGSGHTFATRYYHHYFTLIQTSTRAMPAIPDKMFKDEVGKVLTHIIIYLNKYLIHITETADAISTVL